MLISWGAVVVHLKQVNMSLLTDRQILAAINLTKKNTPFTRSFIFASYSVLHLLRAAWNQLAFATCSTLLCVYVVPEHYQLSVFFF